MAEYYRGEQCWGRAMFQLSTPGMLRADSDHTMQLITKAQEVSGLVCEAFRTLLYILFIVGGIQLRSAISFYSSALPQDAQTRGYSNQVQLLLNMVFKPLYVTSSLSQ